MENQQYDAIVLGAGPAGLSAAIFLGEAELSTLVIADGRTSLSSAYVYNYLGIAEPFHGPSLLETGKQQAEEVGVEFLEASVTEIRQEDDKLVVAIDEQEFYAEYVILASGQGRCLPTAENAGVEMTDCNEPFTKRKVVIDAWGRTSIPRLYAAGSVTGITSQAIIAAGQGAQVALNIISEKEGHRVSHHEVPPKVEA